MRKKLNLGLALAIALGLMAYVPAMAEEAEEVEAKECPTFVDALTTTDRLERRTGQGPGHGQGFATGGSGGGRVGARPGSRVTRRGRGDADRVSARTA